MMRETNMPRRAAWWTVAATSLLLATGCPQSTDADRGRSPGLVPGEIPFEAGQVELFLESNTIPADGRTLTEAVAIVTDAKGRPVEDKRVRFDSEAQGVSWIGAEISDAGSTACFENTNEDGRASCVMRSPFTADSSFVSATALSAPVLGVDELRDRQAVQFTEAGTSSALTLELLDCSESVGIVLAADEVPTTVDLTFQAINSVTGQGPVNPAQIYLETVGGGRFDVNGRDEAVIRTSGASGVARVGVELSSSSVDSEVSVFGWLSGGGLAVCTITIGDFLPPDGEFLLVPPAVEAGAADKQEIAVAFIATEPPQSSSASIRLSASVGSFSPNPAGFDGAGVATSVWTISPSESALLVEGITLPLVGSIEFGGSSPVTKSTTVTVVAAAVPDEEPIEEEEEPPAE